MMVDWRGMVDGGSTSLIRRMKRSVMRLSSSLVTEACRGCRCQ